MTEPINMIMPRVHSLVALLSLLILMNSCATTWQGSPSERSPAQASLGQQDGIQDKGRETPDYPRIFTQVREVLRLEKDGSRRSKKDLAETPIVETIQRRPELIQAEREAVLSVVEEESSPTADPTKHLRLVPPKGEWGYSELKVFSTHPYFRTVNGKRTTVAASNAVQVWSDFLARAQKEIILNVFDFDLQQVAKVLVDKAQSGVDVRVGIDKGVIAARPEVKNVHDRLVQGGVKVTPVDSVALNHQKVAAIDWSDVALARVLFSSGNLTQSCLGPEGDLVQIPKAQRPSKSIPNANHVVTMKSWLLATLVHHELTKTLDPGFQYRGSQYPTTGSYQVTGPGVDPETFEAYPEPSLVVSFSPGGGYRNINRNLIAHFVRNSTGPVRMTQFAYSSAEVAQALRERAERDTQATGKFDFKSVGDTPFAVQFWSQFLKMSGLELVEQKDGRKLYDLSSENDWVRFLSQEQLKRLREGVRIAPIEYGTHAVKVGGVNHQVTAKIHHKIISTGPYAVAGTSFNFSEGAETNNEQIMVFRDPTMVDYVNGATEWLFARSPRSVFQEAMRRNERRGGIQQPIGDQADSQINHSAGEK